MTLLENDFIRLEPLAIEHAHALSQWIDNTDTWTWWVREPPITLEKLKASIEAALIVGKEREPFVIYSKKIDTFIGETSFWYREAGKIEIGSTWISHTVRGTGFNRQVKRLMIDHALNSLNYPHVILQTDVLNIRCRKAIENIGGVLIKRIENHVKVWDGRMRHTVVYSVNEVPE